MMGFNNFITLILLFLALGLTSCGSLLPQSEAISGSSLVYSALASQSRAHLDLDWPVDQARLSQEFKPRGSGRKKRGHQGLDLAAPRGTQVFAAHDGVVVYAGKDYSGYGKLVIVEQGQSWATFYAHLHSIQVKEGQSIAKGERLGTIGRTGRASGNHLHFELRHNTQPIDPLDFLP